MENSNKLENTKIDYELLEQQRANALQANLKAELRQREGNLITSLRRAVLRFVIEGDYEKAEHCIDIYVDAKKTYPDVRGRVEPHVQHSKELINAIRTKRNFPNLGQLSMSKQQEVLDFAISHFEELKSTLKSIENAARDEAIRDFRSTEWFLRTCVYTVVAVVTLSFIYEVTAGGMARSIYIVYDILTEKLYVLAQKVFPFL